jgi:hypothetical protein
VRHDVDERLAQLRATLAAAVLQGDHALLADDASGHVRDRLEVHDGQVRHPSGERDDLGPLGDGEERADLGCSQARHAVGVAGQVRVGVEAHGGPAAGGWPERTASAAMRTVGRTARPVRRPSGEEVDQPVDDRVGEPTLHVRVGQPPRVVRVGEEAGLEHDGRCAGEPQDRHGRGMAAAVRGPERRRPSGRADGRRARGRARTRTGPGPEVAGGRAAVAWRVGRLSPIETMTSTSAVVRDVRPFGASVTSTARG